MITKQKAKLVAIALSKLDHDAARAGVELLLDVIDTLEFLDERDTVSDSRLQFLRRVGDGWKDAALSYQRDLTELRQINDELRKQNQMLKAALLKE